MCLCYPVWRLPAVFWQWLVQGDIGVESPAGTFQGTSSAACRRMLLADRNLRISGSVPGRTFPAKFRRNPVSDTHCHKMLFPTRAMNLWIMLRCENTYNRVNRQNGTEWRDDWKQSWLILEAMYSVRRLATRLTSLVLSTILQSESCAACSRSAPVCELKLSAFPLLWFLSVRFEVVCSTVIWASGSCLHFC